MALFDNNDIDMFKIPSATPGSAKKSGVKIPIEPGAVWENSVTRFRKGRKYETIQEVIGELQKNATCHGVTAGAWSHQDFLYWIIADYGPVHLVVATWTIGNKIVERILTLVREKKILSAKFLFDRQVKQHKEKAYHLIKAQDDLDISLANVHAKTSVIWNDKIAISISGSQNWTKNPRVERFTLSTVPAVVEFDKKWIMELHSKSDKFDVNINDIRNMPDMKPSDRRRE